MQHGSSSTVPQPDTVRLMGTSTVCIMRHGASRPALALASAAGIGSGISRRRAASAVARSSVCPRANTSKLSWSPRLASPRTTQPPTNYPQTSTTHHPPPIEPSAFILQSKARPAHCRFVCATVNTGNE